MSRDPLEFDRETMRDMGYRVVDLPVERIAGLPSAPVLRTAGRAEMEARIHGPAPAGPVDFGLLLEPPSTI